MLRKVLLYVVLGAFTLYVLGPLLWLAISSFKPTGQIIKEPFGFPTELYLGNYHELNQSNFWLFYRNSVLVVAGSLVGIAIFGTTLAYGIAAFQYRGREVLSGAVFSAILLPPSLVVIPLFQQVQNYNMLDSHLGLMVVYTAFALPVSVFILRAFFVKIPTELGDAARVDGASEWQVFRRVVLPVARPAVATVLILWFVFLFNEFVLSLILLQTTTKRTLPVGLTLLNSEYGVNFGAMSAALVMSAVPILTIFTLFSERFVKGMTAGAIKG